MKPSDLSTNKLIRFSLALAITVIVFLIIKKTGLDSPAFFVISGAFYGFVLMVRDLLCLFFEKPEHKSKP